MRTPSFGSDMVELCFWLQRAHWFHGNGFVAAATAMVMPSRKFIRFNLSSCTLQLGFWLSENNNSAGIALCLQPRLQLCSCGCSNELFSFSSKMFPNKY